MADYFSEIVTQRSRAAAGFYDENRVSMRGVPERAGLSELVADMVKITNEPIRSTVVRMAVGGMESIPAFFKI